MVFLWHGSYYHLYVTTHPLPNPRYIQDFLEILNRMLQKHIEVVFLRCYVHNAVYGRFKDPSTRLYK